jgi:hypothetical protein
MRHEITEVSELTLDKTVDRERNPQASPLGGDKKRNQRVFFYRL